MQDMLSTRRVIALVLLLLAAPSLLWCVVGLFAPIPSFPEWRSREWWFEWADELFFVLCFLGASFVVWKGFRAWAVVLLVTVGLHTYLHAWLFIQEVLFAPSHFVTYFPLVLKEAANRGTSGAALIWSLIVFPLALPALLLTSIWLCFVRSDHLRHASNL